MYCFVLYLIDMCQTDGNANFKYEFHNWTKKVDFIIKVIELQLSTTFVVTSLFLCLRAT